MRCRGLVIFRSLFTAGTVLLFFSAENCPGAGAPFFKNTHADTIDGVIFSTSTDRAIYKKGDSLRLRYRIRNNSMGTVLYDFSTPCQFEALIIGSDGNTVFSLLSSGSPTGRRGACTPKATRLMLAPSAERIMGCPPVPLNLPGTDTLTVKIQMASYPLSAVPVTITYVADSALPPAPLALEETAVTKPALEFNSETKTLIIRVSHAQRLTVSAFIVTGPKVNKLSCERFFAPGTHRISFNNPKLADGVVIFKVEGKGFSQTKTINLAR